MTSDPGTSGEIRRFEEQYADNPDSFVFARLADAHRKIGNPDRALQILQQGLDRHPEYLSGHIVHARCLKDLGREIEAAAAWQSVLELDPDNMVALRELAALAVGRGDTAAAERWSARLLQVDPQSEVAKDVVANLAEDEDEPPPVSEPEVGDDESPEGAPLLELHEAEPASEGWGEGAQQVADQAPGLVTETMAELYLSQGLYEEAASVLWELVKQQPADGNLRERLAEARAKARGDEGPSLPPQEPLPGSTEGSPGNERAITEAGAATVPLEVVEEPPSTEEGDSTADLSGATGDDTDGQPPADAAAPSDAEATAGMRSFLRALLKGEASVDSAEAETEAPRPSSDEGSARTEDPDSFGEWLRRRGR